MGPVVEVDESYARDLAVPPVVLFPLLIAAAVVDAVGLVISTIFQVRVPSARRPLKALRKGPEYMVTPIRVRDADDTVVEVEVHGYLNRTAVVRRDRIRTVTRRQKGDLPLLVAGTIENLSTGRVLRPRRATLLTHLGPGLIAQAVLGALLVAFVVAVVLGAF
jgi:hypothetical protein